MWLPESHHANMLFQPEPTETGRPAGVTLLAGVMLLYAATAIVYAALLTRGSIAMSNGAWLIGGGFEIMGKWIFVLYAALHAAYFGQGTFLYVPRGLRVTQPLRSVGVHTGGHAGFFPHTLAVLEQGAAVIRDMSPVGALLSDIQLPSETLPVKSR